MLCGDFDPEEALRLAEQYFGGFAKKKKPAFHFEPQQEIASRIQKDVYGNEAPWVEIGWRIGGAQSPEAKILPVIAAVLHNGHAGLMDEHLALVMAHPISRLASEAIFQMRRDLVSGAGLSKRLIGFEIYTPENV